MKSFFSSKLTGMLVLGTLALASCVDSNYDLSNLNKDIQFDFTDLVVPIRIAPYELQLKKVIEEGDIIKIDTVINGNDTTFQYAIRKRGDFSSQEITVKGAELAAPTIQEISGQIDLEKLISGEESHAVKPRYGRLTDNTKTLPESATDTIAQYSLTTNATRFKAETTVDTALADLTSIKVNTTFTIPLSVSDLNTVLNPIKFSNFIIKLPSGLTADFEIYTSPETKKKLSADAYDKETGFLYLDSLMLYAEDNQYSSKLVFGITEIKEINAKWSPMSFDAATHNIKFEDSLRIVNGSIAIRMCDFKHYDPSIEPCVNPTTPAEIIKAKAWAEHFQALMNELPKKVSYLSNPGLEKITVNSFCGKISYSFSGLNVSPISLKDLPDILTKEGTDIFLKNPQIHLRLNNPLQQKGYELYGATAISLVSKWKDGFEKTSTMDDPNHLVILIDQPDNTCVLSPTQPTERPGFESPTHYRFSSLSTMLSKEDGKGGLPDSIKINIINPGIPEQEVTDFKLGETFNKVEGKYEFFAPLELDENKKTIIHYVDTVKTDLDSDLGITAKLLNVNVSLKSDVPMSCDLTATIMLTKNGKLEKTDRSVTVPNGISAKMDWEERLISIENALYPGEILGGVLIDATLKNGASSEVLSPRMKLYLKDPKISITGNYQKTL